MCFIVVDVGVFSFEDVILFPICYQLGFVYKVVIHDLWYNYQQRLLQYFQSGCLFFVVFLWFL